MKKLTDAELALAPDWLREAIEGLNDPMTPPNCPPFRPYTPWEKAWIRAAMNRGWLRAEDCPALLDAKEKEG